MPRDPLRAAFGVPLELAEHTAPHEQTTEPYDPRLASGNAQLAQEREAARAEDEHLNRPDPALARQLARYLRNRRQRRGRGPLTDPRNAAVVDDTLADALMGARRRG